jgi:sterol desaturase/sphingolipid hydroxylase (fatty acid hydroxylase superfamily)
VTFVLSNQFPFEIAVRLAAFAMVFAAMAWAESAMPRRARSFPRTARWPANISVTAINSVLVRVVIPTTAMAAAFYAEHRGVGLLNSIALPRGVAFVAAAMILDLTIYLTAPDASH